jgi:predicted Zn-dependent peptidase
VNRQTTSASLEGITKEDISGFHKKYFHPANFVVSVSGDFDREAMIAKLEKLFADWPFKGETAPPIPTDIKMAEPGIYLVNKDVNQGRVSVALPGIKTDDPDYFAGDVMNDILGGGGFTSRIMSRVRSDEGLAYSAGSALPGGTYYPLAFRAAFQSKSRTVAYATSLVLEEMRKIAAQPVTDEELKTAKQSSIETFPRTFASKRATAGVFAQDEFTGRYAKNPTYWQTYRDKIAAVTTADVQRVAKRLLDPDKAVILIVGEKKEILLGHPNHTVKLEELSKGKLHSVPLRDPLTMKPMAAE